MKNKIVVSEKNKRKQASFFFQPNSKIQNIFCRYCHNLGGFFFLRRDPKIGKVDRRREEFLQWEAAHICILTKREKNKPLVWSGHTAFNSSQLQPCCRVLVMAILEYKLFTCSNTQTTAGIQVFFFHLSLLFFFTPLLRLCVCESVLCVCLSGFMQLCQAGESIWMKNKTLVAS